MPDLSELVGRGVSRERAYIAVRVATLCVRRNWGWSDLAREAGINAFLVEGLERGTRDVRFSTLLKLAKALSANIGLAARWGLKR